AAALYGWAVSAGTSCPEYEPAAVNNTSVDEFSAVSAASCNTPMMKPTPTTWIARSLEMPKRLQAGGSSTNEPPATPDAPQAQMVATTLSNKAVGRSTGIPGVFTAASVSTVMVTDAPAILIVAPSG